MTAIIDLLLTVLAALCGGLIGRALKIPAGVMLGALFFVVLMNVFTDRAYVPGDFRPWIQMTSGALLGSGISRRDIKELKYLLVPGMIMLIGMLLFNLAFGYLMFRFSTLDLATCLLAMAPGGMTDMSLIAADLGGDMATVTILHLVRLLVIYAVLPWIFARLSQYQKRNGLDCQADPVGGRAQTGASANAGVEQLAPAGRGQAAFRVLLTFAFAAAGGFLLWQIGVTAGAMIGAMLAVAALNLVTGKAVCPKKVRVGVQVMAGAFVGQTITRDSFGLMAGLLLPVLIMVASVLIFMLAISACLIWLSKLDRATCILASAPGGLQEVSLMAVDLNADAPKVMVMQTTRLMVVIALFPTLLSGAAEILD